MGAQQNRTQFSGMRMMSRTKWVIGLLAIAASCDNSGSDTRWAGSIDTLASGRVVIANPETGAWDSASAWTIVEELRIGTMDGTGRELFGSVAGIEVDAQGRIWVLDRNAKEVRVFASDGSHVRTMGRLGSGPGEFRDPIGIALSRAGEAWIVDPGNARYAVFDSAGNYVAAHQRQIGGYTVPWRGGFNGDGQLLEAANVRAGNEFRSALVRYNESMQLVDTILVPHFDASAFEVTNVDRSIVATVPYAPSMVWSFSLDGTLWSGINEEYRLFQQNLEGDTLREITREYERLPVTNAERDTAISRMSWFTNQGGSMDASKIPSRKPAFSRIDIAPDGHLWIAATQGPDPVGTVFDIFDPDGRYLGEVRSQTTLRGLRFHDGRVFALATDSLGVTYVVRLSH